MCIIAAQHEVGSLVRYTRMEKRLRQDDCAAAAGMPRSTWSDLERGHVKLTLDRMRQVAKGLGVPFTDLRKGK